MPNGTLIAVLLVVAIGLSILYAILGGDEPLISRDRSEETPAASATAVATP